VRAPPAAGLGLCAAVAVATGGCGGTGALDVGSDLEPEGGVVAGFDATAEASPGLDMSIAEKTPDACSPPCLAPTAEDAGSFVYWAEWQDVDGGWMSGVLSPPSGTIRVVYTGPLAGSQTTTGDNDFTPSSTFTSATVADPPPGPGMIEVSGGVTATTPPDTLTFSEPVTNPVLAIYDLGMGYALDSASLVFDAPFAVLSSGPNAGGVTYFGGETLVPVDGGVSGSGSNGVVELEGKFTTIRWPNPNETMYATFTGITVGIRTQR
jgi:hypothetical protein